MIRIFVVVVLLVLSGIFYYDKKNVKLIKRFLSAQEIYGNNYFHHVAVDTSYDSSLLLTQHLQEIQQEKNMPVHIVKDETPDKLAYVAMTKLNPMLDPEKPVLLKPNLGGFIGIKEGEDNGVTGRTTSPDFVKGIIRYLREKGVKDIAIGESWGVTDPKQVQKLFQVSGYKKLASEMNIKLIDLNYYNEKNSRNVPVLLRYPDAKVLKNDIYISKEYLRYLNDGIVINIPKLKTHLFAITSLSMKNMMGVLMMQGKSSYLHANKSNMHPEINSWFQQKNIAGEERLEKYKDSFALFSDRLTDLFIVTKPDFTIIEGYYGTEGDGFDKIRLRKERIAFASYNQIFADYVASTYMGFVHSDSLRKRFGFDSPLYLTKSMERWYPDIIPEKDIQIDGPEKFEKVQNPYWLVHILDRFKG